MDSDLALETFMIGVVVIALPILLIMQIVKWLRPRKPMFCTTCGYFGKPKRRAKGSLTLEILLWLVLIIPGVFYSLWRSFNIENVCEKCGSTNVIPSDSPFAQRARPSGLSEQDQRLLKS
jgi:hypothetical protein